MREHKTEVEILQSRVEFLAKMETDEEKIVRLMEENRSLWDTATEFRRRIFMYRQKIISLYFDLAAAKGEAAQKAEHDISDFYQVTVTTSNQ